MDFIGLLKIMLRRWFIVIPVLAVAFVLGSSYVDEPISRWAASGSELLVVEQAQQTQTAQTAIFGSSVAGGVFRTALTQPSYRTDLQERRLVNDFTVVDDGSPSVISIDIQNPDAQAVLATGQAIAADAEGLLAEAVGAAEASAVTLRAVSNLTEEDVVTIGPTSTMRVSIAVLPRAGGFSNPYPPNATTLRLVVEIAMRPSVIEAVQAVAPSALISVGSERRDVAPIINVTVNTATEAELVPAYQAAINGIQRELELLQFDAGVPVGAQTILMNLTPPGGGETRESSSVRQAAGIALLGVGAACLLAVLVDALIIRWRARSAAKRDEMTQESEGSFEVQADDQADEDEFENEFDQATALPR